MPFLTKDLIYMWKKLSRSKSSKQVKWPKQISNPWALLWDSDYGHSNFFFGRGRTVSLAHCGCHKLNSPGETALNLEMDENTALLSLHRVTSRRQTSSPQSPAKGGWSSLNPHYMNCIHMTNCSRTHRFCCPTQQRRTGKQSIKFIKPFNSYREGHST